MRRRAPARDDAGEHVHLRAPMKRRLAGDELIEQGILHNAIKQVDLLISEAKDKLKHSPVTVGPVGNVNMVEVVN